MMRNVTTFLASLLVAVGTFASMASTTVRNGVTLLGVDREVISKSLSPTGLEPAAKAKSPLQVQVPRGSRRAPALASLAGYYYTTDYGTSVPLAVSQRYMVQITPFAADSVEIFNLMGGGRAVKGVYSATTGVIKIKPQVTFVDSKYGSLYCCPVDLDKKAYYTDSEIELSVSADGNISIGSWGIFVLSGQYKGTQLVSSKTKMYKANAMITDHSLSQTVDSLKVRTYPACYTRESKTQIVVRNFYNCGSEVVMTVDSTGAVFMPHQVLATVGVTNYYNYCISKYTTASDVTLKASGLNGTFDADSICFGAWAMSRSTAKSAIVESLVKSVVRVPEVFAPFSSELGLQGAGTETDPYMVTNAQDLEALANATNHNAAYKDAKNNVFTGVYFKQTADIDMASVANHEPIGVDKAMFNGRYDGQNHTISNLAQDRRNEFYAGMFGLTGENAEVANIKFVNSSVRSDKSKVATVVGENNGKVSGITVADGYVGSGAFYNGGIVGMNDGTGVIENTSFSGTIEGESMNGGIVGVNYNAVSSSWSDATINVVAQKGSAGGVCGSDSRATSSITDCYFTGVITDTYGGGELGGIVGYNYLGTISRCWNGGQVNASSTQAHTGSTGGIVGRAIGVKINDSYNSGIVRSYTSDFVGGVAGKFEMGAAGTTTASDAPELNRCLNTGILLCAPSAQNNELAGAFVGDTAIINNTYFDGQVCFNGSTAHSLPTATLASGNAPEGFDASVWTLAAGHYPQLAKAAATNKAKLDAVPFTLAAGETVKRLKSDFTICSDNNVKWNLFNGSQLTSTGHGLKLDGNKVSVTATTAVSDTLTATLGSDFRIYILKVVPDEFEGAGTEANPFLIKTKEDLLKIQNAVDVQLYDYTGVNFKLANDIDMGGASSFFGLSVHGVDYAFNGTLDGDGHAIKNWKVNRSFAADGGVTENMENAMAGLLIYTGHKSVVKNLNIAADCQIEAGSYVAGVTSYNGGRIENCRNYATVKAAKAGAAGVVAYNAEGSTVTGCYNAGTVLTGQSAAGGVVAANFGTVEYSQNDGVVGAAVLSSLETDSTKLENVGGVIGVNNGTITNSLNQGYVSGGNCVGGVVGYSNTRTTNQSLLSTGVVYSFADLSKLGTVFGYYNSSNTTTADCYYDSQLAGKNAGNALAVDGVDKLSTASLVSGSAVGGLDAERWDYAAAQYPVLKAFASEPASQFNRANYILFESGDKTDSRFSVRYASQVVAQQGVTYALKKANNFTLSGSTLNIAPITEAESDTLTFTSGAYSKSYPLFAAPKMLPNGEGTKDNPWRIASVADWQTVARYSKAYEASFEGEYMLLVNDIDFGGDADASLMLVDDGSTRFQGHFDGNGKTIDGFKYYNEDQKTGSNKGLFGLVGDNGVIENLTLGAGSSLGGYWYTGGFAGLSSGTMINCVNRAQVATLKMGFAGGLVGMANPKARFVNCRNYGVITSANGQAGGIVGSTDTDVALDSCYNAGSVDGKYSNGGIVGSSKATITNSLNAGVITSSQYNAGGIAGYQSNAESVVAGCVNRAKITAYTYGAGGIIGNIASADVVKNNVNYGEIEADTYGAGGIVGNSGSNPFNLIDSCYNYASVLAKTYSAGGIVGSVGKGSATAGAVVSHSVNYGEITATKYSAGGIAGTTAVSSTLEQNVNYGNVGADYQAGGVVGNLSGAVTGCYNVATVEARYNLGGVCGNSASGAVVKESGNAGEVWSTGTSASTAYNVGGVMGTGKGVLTDVYNHGTVYGYKQVGGIIGLPVKFYTEVTNAYSTGSVECASAADSASCGNVYGGVNITNVTYTDVYFDRQYAGATYANDADTMALPTVALTKLQLDSTWTLRANCYPVMSALADSSVVKFYSAALVLDSLDARDHVKKAFYVGVPEGVTWTVTRNLLLDADGRVNLANATAGETAKLTVALDGNDKLVREYEIVIEEPSGAADIDAQKEIDHVDYITVNGLVLREPVMGVNIVRTYYKDGTTSTRKMLISPKR